MAPRAALLALTLLALALAPPTGTAAGPTYVEGPVEGVWTLEGSPYVLVGNATVPADASLTIGAGVEVRADRAVHLMVLGSLRVAGTADAPIRFTANGTGTPGAWGGIVTMGALEVTLAHAIVEFALAGLSVSSGTAFVEGSSFTRGVTGVLAVAAEVSLVDTSVSHSLENGVAARDSQLSVLAGLLTGNREGLNLVTTGALVENTTFLGPTLADASLDLGSLLRLRASSGEGLVKIVDDASRADVEGLLAVAVTDAFEVPLQDAIVSVEDNPNGTAMLQSTAGPEGRTGFIVTERTITKAGESDFNPFKVTAEHGGTFASTGVTVRGRAEVSLAVPVDFQPPAPVAARFLVAVEDEPVTFDASMSTDNDPDLLATGTFRWTFPEIAVELHGVTVGYTFATPGLYQGALTVTDAAGNEAILTFAVRVRDVTVPTIAKLVAPQRGTVGDVLTYEASATDNDPAFLSRASYHWRFTLDDDLVETYGPRVSVAFVRSGTWTLLLTVADGDGNAATVERSLVIAAPPPPPSALPWVGGGAAMFAAALGLATERGKLALLTLLLPLYTRIKDDEVLDQFTRGQIYGYIRVHPGDTYTDIKRNLELNNGTLTYHLDVLKKQGLIRAVSRGSRKMFYPVEVRPVEDGGGLHELQQRLLRVLGEAPGAGVGDLAAVLGVSRQLALYHLRLLSQEGLVRLERKGLKLRGFVVERQS